MPPEAQIDTVTPILNNRESLVQLQLPAKHTKVGAQPGMVIQLIPGMNFIDTAQWLKAKENETVRFLLTDLIQPSKAPEQNPERVNKPHLVEGKPVSKDNPLAAMTDKDADAAVSEMFDCNQMRKFLAQEERQIVRNALKAQIDKIEKPKADKKK